MAEAGPEAGRADLLLRAQGIAVGFDPACGIVTALRVTDEGREVAPLHRAPWVGTPETGGIEAPSAFAPLLCSRPSASQAYVCAWLGPCMTCVRTSSPFGRSLEGRGLGRSSRDGQP